MTAVAKCRAAGTARKGDIVALETTHISRFINPPYRSESRQEFTLVKVASATRDGIVKAIETKWGYVQKLAHMAGKPRVYTLSDRQDNARRLLASLTDDGNLFTSTAELKAAILAA
jgi:hypothetical protein